MKKTTYSAFWATTPAGTPASGPYFVTKPANLSAVRGETLRLPCHAVNIGGYVQAWKRGIAVLTAGDMKVTPDTRLRIVGDQYDLEIAKLNVNDTGEYVCQVAANEPIEITHSLLVKVPPSIDQVTSGGLVEVKKGSRITLECKISGIPLPTVTWTRKPLSDDVRGAVGTKWISLKELDLEAVQCHDARTASAAGWLQEFPRTVATDAYCGKSLSNCARFGNKVENNLVVAGEKSITGPSLSINRTTRHHAGVYMCTADNGVVGPVTKEITVNILYPPEIEVERAWVHSGIGSEAQLVCIVHAHPPADDNQVDVCIGEGAQRTAWPGGREPAGLAEYTIVCVIMGSRIDLAYLRPHTPLHTPPTTSTTCSHIPAPCPSTEPAICHLGKTSSTYSCERDYWNRRETGGDKRHLHGINCIPM